jgi:hypothetical protein
MPRGGLFRELPLLLTRWHWDRSTEGDSLAEVSALAGTASP